MLDDAFTYGGWVLGLIAVGVWIWLARRAFPSFESFVTGFDDELQLGASPEERARSARWRQVRQAAMALTAVAALCLSIGFAIPD
ncbi:MULTISPECIES: hypothetical protein [Methylobacterium]|jgi:uncharacterized iron-regulated membrane protein|uniref:hypothetical protein n=1 Tax=Methylobacterium TaxID=407 RepID=UPI00034D0AAC|nr:MULTISPECIES: hypothetical protein [Methylobacterium]MBN4095103.1 hypothetical protein [Methylobacterium sp. OT2]UIN32519.1 hypothetical protein LXM90_15475 [Methylobacterium oryzae]SEF91072.1 hypothetical protein SAMN04488144_106208 [Methylobacterium sp. 190mf]SEH31428.1 hypothetical protein SAMN02799636_01065 [Methylobacterium sp. 275MFSha3.1]SEP23217.1 hypothetical protein SAMN02799625_05104 [Methylobacterium sp. UNC300MFChir4.1]